MLTFNITNSDLMIEKFIVRKTAVSNNTNGDLGYYGRWNVEQYYSKSYIKRFIVMHPTDA